MQIRPKTILYVLGTRFALDPVSRGLSGENMGAVSNQIRNLSRPNPDLNSVVRVQHIVSPKSNQKALQIDEWVGNIRLTAFCEPSNISTV